MFFQSATDEEANALFGKKFPHPALVFAATEKHLSVRALPKDERPTRSTLLMSAPYWNTYRRWLSLYGQHACAHVGGVLFGCRGMGAGIL
jgi:hypothetical protein